MQGVYPAKYRDRNGEVATSLKTDGKTLRLVVRGVEFTGKDFDSLDPVVNTPPEALASFALHQGSLYSCAIEFDMPIPVVGAGSDLGLLHVRISLGEPVSSGCLDYRVELDLELGEAHFLSSGKHGEFEGELLDLQGQLPDGTYLKTCFNCAFSDYSPLGRASFGDLACFRDNKDQYREVSSKGDLFRIWKTMTEYVQETWLCPEFERRRPGAGYRG